MTHTTSGRPVFYRAPNKHLQLRGKRRLVIPCVNPTNYGLHSFRYYASKLWNLLPDNVCVSTSLAAIKIALKTVQLDNEWCSQWPMLNSQITCTYLYIFYLYYSIFIYLSVYFTYWCTLIQFYRFIFFRDISNSAKFEVKQIKVFDWLIDWLRRNGEENWGENSRG